MAKLIKIVLVIAAVIVAVVLFKPNHAAPAPAACSLNTPPCIELLGPGGQVVAKFNDFRFGAKGCVYYRSDVRVTNWQHYCGGTLQWIGPNPASKS